MNMSCIACVKGTSWSVQVHSYRKLHTLQLVLSQEWGQVIVDYRLYAAVQDNKDNVHFGEGVGVESNVLSPRVCVFYDFLINKYAFS